MTQKDFVQIQKQLNLRKTELEIEKLKKLKNNQKEFVAYSQHVMNTKKGQTPSTYLQRIRMFFEFKDVNWKEITEVDVNAFLGHLRNKKDSKDSCIKLSWSCINEFFKYVNGLTRREIPEIFKRIPCPMVERKETRPINLMQVSKLWNCWGDNVRNKAILHVLYESMRRISEFSALRIKDVDLSTIPANVTLRTSKTQKGKQAFCLLYNSIPILKQWLNVHPMKDDPESPLFVTIRGEPLSKRTISKIVTESGGRSGIGHVYPHLLRHTRTFEMIRVHGMSPQEVMRLGGWKTSKMLDVYYQPQYEDILEKFCESHGLRKFSKEERINALKGRNVRLCVCGHENPFDQIFCGKCNSVLDINEYREYIENKDNKLNKMESKLKMMEDILLKQRSKVVSDKLKGISSKIYKNLNKLTDEEKSVWKKLVAEI